MFYSFFEICEKIQTYLSTFLVHNFMIFFNNLLIRKIEYANNYRSEQFL